MFHHSVKFQCYVSLPEDGKLSYAEFAAHAVDNAMRHELFNHFDTDKDGFLQKAEMVDNNFNAMDQNGTFPSISRTDKLRLTCVIKKNYRYILLFSSSIMVFVLQVTTRSPDMTLITTTPM